MNLFDRTACLSRMFCFMTVRSESLRMPCVCSGLPVFIAFLLLLLVHALPSAIAMDASMSRKSAAIAIGCLWDLSGPGSMAGQAALKGARQAVHDINSRAGIHGRNIILTVADTAGSPGTLLQNASRMVSERNCSLILGPTHAVLARTIRGFAEAHKVPLFLTAGDEPVLPLRGHPVSWTFSVSTPITAEARRLFSSLRRKRLVPVGIVASDDSMGQRAALWLKGYAQEYQILTGELQGFGTRDTDIISQIRALRGAGASTVFVWARHGISRMIASSFRKLPGRYAVPCIMLDDSLLTTAQSGVTIITAVPPVLLGENLGEEHPCFPALKRFSAAMAGDIEYMTIQELLASAAAWDAMHIAAMAMRNSGTSHRSIKAAMEEAELEYAGAMGLFRPVKRDHCGLVAGSLVPATPSGYGWRAF